MIDALKRCGGNLSHSMKRLSEVGTKKMKEADHIAPAIKSHTVDVIKKENDHLLSGLKDSITASLSNPVSQVAFNRFTAVKHRFTDITRETLLHFTGREWLVNNVMQELDNEDTKSLIVLGDAGIGKTQS